MWVPSTQGFSDPQGVQSRDHRPGTCRVARTERRDCNPRSSQLPPAPALVHTNSNCCPKKATLSISSSFWEKGTSNPALVPLQREHRAFGQRRDKGKVGFEQLEATKIFFLTCQIENCSSFQGWPLPIFPVGSVRHRRK